MLQCKKIPQPYEGKVSVKGIIYYPDNRHDLDESLILDGLQHAGIIKNDRQVRYKEFTRGIDAKDPRVSFVIQSYEDEDRGKNMPYL